MTESSRTQRDESSMTAAGKALAVLSAFESSRAVLGVSDLARLADVSKSTAHRLVQELISHGYVKRNGDRYQLSERMWELGNQVRALRPNGLRDRAMPYMAELFSESRETIHLGVLAGTEVLYLEKIHGHTAIPCQTSTGSRRPTYCTALGKAMVAFADQEAVEANMNVDFRRFTGHTYTGPGQLYRALHQVRESGIATDFEEFQVGLTCIASPILSKSGSLVGALSISSVTSRGDIRRFTPALSRATRELSARLGAADG